MVAREIREFAVTVPAGTTVAAPLVTDISFPERVVTAISWRVPPGPSGRLGWQLTSAGAPVIPIQQRTYVVTDNQSDTWLVDGYLDSGNWQVTAFNTGVYPHTVYFSFQLDIPGLPASPVGGGLGNGVGVIGTGGIIVPQGPPGPPVSAGGTADDTAAVVTSVILGAFLAQLAGQGAG